MTLTINPNSLKTAVNQLLDVNGMLTEGTYAVTITLDIADLIVTPVEYMDPTDFTIIPEPVYWKIAHKLTSTETVTVTIAGRAFEGNIQIVP